MEVVDHPGWWKIVVTNGSGGPSAVTEEVVDNGSGGDLWKWGNCHR